MPGIEEVRSYLIGLWLLIKGSRTGFAFLDLSERGSLRSFWAILWCFPAILLTWIWVRLSYLDAMPPGTSAGLVYFIRLALSELAGWIVPVLLTGFVTGLTGYGNRFNAIVAAVNWLSVPFAYGNALLLLVMIIAPGLPGLVAFIWLLLLGGVVIALERILRMICGPNMLLIAALILVQMVPVLFLSDWLEHFLGTAVP